MSQGVAFPLLVIGGCAAIVAVLWADNAANAASAPGLDPAPADPAAPGAGIADLWPAGLSDIGTRAANEASALLDSLGVSMGKIFNLPSRALQYAPAIDAASAKYGLPDNLLAALLNQESGFSPAVIDGTRLSSAGAIGIAQFMPATAADLGIDPTNPYQSIDAAGKYLRSLYDALGSGSWADALAAYNWGIGNVKRKGIAAAPAETQNYVSSISAAAGLA